MIRYTRDNFDELAVLKSRFMEWSADPADYTETRRLLAEACHLIARLRGIQRDVAGEVGLAHARIMALLGGPR